MSPESIKYAGAMGLNLMVIPYAVSLAKVKDTITMYRDALADAGHNQDDHSVMGPAHLFVDENEAKAIAAVREPIVRYVGYLRDAVKSDKWSKDYQGYEGMVKMTEALMDFDVLYNRRSVCGDPAHASECIEAFRDAGIDEISFVTIMPGLGQASILDSMRCFASEIMPKYQN